MCSHNIIKLKLFNNKWQNNDIEEQLEEKKPLAQIKQRCKNKVIFDCAYVCNAKYV